MKWRYLAQNLYKSTISQTVPAIWLSGTQLDEFEIICTNPPANSSGWIFLDFEYVEKRDLIFFHKKVWNTIYYYRKNRDLLNNWSRNVRHEEQASLQQNDVSERINFLTKNVDDFWFVEYPYWGNLILKVYWGLVKLFSTEQTIPDTILTTVNWTKELVFKFADTSFSLIDTVDLSTLVWIHIWTVVALAWAITSYTDVRTISFWPQFSATYFEMLAWQIVIKSWSISLDRLSAAVQTSLWLSHSHTNSSTIWLFSTVDWNLYWNWHIMDQSWEANTMENIWSWLWVYKEKIWVVFKIKTLKWSGSIWVVDQWDFLEITSWQVTESATETFTWDWIWNTFSLTDSPIWAGLVWIVSSWWVMLVNWVDFTINWKDITFTNIPVLGEKMYITYIKVNALWQAAVWEINTASNFWSVWLGLYKDKVGVNLRFKKLKAGANITIAEDPEWLIQIDASGTWWAGTTTSKWVPTWLINSSNVTFSIPAAPVANWLFLYQNWMVLLEGVDYTLAWTTITMTTAPITWDVLYYTTVIVATETIWRTYTWSIDWVNKSFALWATPKANSTYVYLNWITQLEWVDYTVSSNVVTFVTAPITWDTLQIKYFYI